MARADRPDIKRSECLDAPENEGREGCNDACIVSLGLGSEKSPLLFGQLVIKHTLITSEGTEGITGEEDSVFLDEGHHGIRPVDVRGCVEDKCLTSDIKLLTVCDDVHVLVSVQGFSLGCTESCGIYLNVGTSSEKHVQGTCVVGLHVVEYEDVDVLKSQSHVSEIAVKGCS